MKYIGIKFVDAVPMTADVAKDKGYRVNDSTGDGYEVTFDDGYKSWCPKNVFEKLNFENLLALETRAHIESTDLPSLDDGSEVNDATHNNNISN